MPSPKHLPAERIRALHAVAVRARLTQHRDELLLGIDPGITSNLPFAATASAQILSDLFHLANTHPRDGSVPPIHWLRNALRLLGTNEDASILEDALDHLGEPVAERRPASPHH